MGRGERRHPFYPLVPAHDRFHRREARQLHLPRRRRTGGHGLFRQGAGEGRAGCLQLSLRRPEGHLRGQGLHRVGPHIPRVYQGPHPVHSHRLLFLQRRSAGQENAPASLHGDPGPGGGEDPSPAGPERCGRRLRHHRAGTGVFPGGQRDL